MLRNQLALTEGIKDNQKAITQGFSQFERLADMKELPGIEAFEDEDDEDEEEVEAPPKEVPKTKTPIAKFNVEELDKDLNNKESQDILKKENYKHLPYYFDKDVDELSEVVTNVNSALDNTAKDIRNTAVITKKGDYFVAEAKSPKPRSLTIQNIKKYNTLSKYSTRLGLLLMFKEQSGSGMFFVKPEELLKRFELLSGSLAAGNNGVLPEYIQLAHRLRDLGIMTNKQLNKLLKYIVG